MSFVEKFSHKFMDANSFKKKRKPKLGVINEIVLKERQELMHRIKAKEKIHKAEAKERWKVIHA